MNDPNLDDDAPVRQFSTGTMTAGIFLAAVIFSSYQWNGALSVLYVAMLCGVACFLIAGWRQNRSDHYQWIMLGLFCLVLALIVGAAIDPQDELQRGIEGDTQHYRETSSGSRTPVSSTEDL